MLLMEKNIAYWLTRWESRPLPVLRHTIDALKALQNSQDEVSAGKIAGIVLRDPLMTLQMLRTINNMPHGRFAGTEIASIEHTVMLFGIQPFFQQFTQLPILEDCLSATHPIHAHLLNAIEINQHTALQVRDWSALRMDAKVEEVGIAGLLFNYGELLLCALEPDTAAQLLAANNHRHLYQASLEHHDILGTSLLELQQAYGLQQKLPRLLLELTHPEELSAPRVMIVTLAHAIAQAADHGWHNAALDMDIKVAARFLHLSPEQMLHRVYQNAIAAAREWHWTGSYPAARWLPLLLEAPSLPPLAVRVEKARQELQAASNGQYTLAQISTRVLKNIGQNLQLRRMVLALISPDGQQLKAKYIAGAPDGSPLRRFQCGAKDGQLFARLLSKPQAIWLNADNQSKFSPLISSELRQMIGEGEFLAMSIFANDKPFALIYADRGREDDAPALDDATYQAFKQLCLQAGQAFSHLAPEL